MSVNLRSQATHILGVAAFVVLWTMSVLAGPNAPPDADKRVVVVLETRRGDIRIEVRADRAPETAAYFLELVDAGHYNGATFYRSAALDGEQAPQVVQGGLLYRWLQGDASRAPPTGIQTLPFTETTAFSGLSHRTGAVSMARDLLNTGDVISEFFICLRDAPNLDYGQSERPDANGFPVFGRVLQGMKTLSDIAALETRGKTHISLLQNQILTQPVQIIRAYRVERKKSSAESSPQPSLTGIDTAAPPPEPSPDTAVSRQRDAGSQSVSTPPTAPLR